MAIELVTKYSKYVDELFTQESKHEEVTNKDFDWTGAKTVKVYKVGTADMNDYGRTGAASGNWSRYGAVADLDATTETLTLTKDRSFTFCIDKLDQDETGDALEAASALARQQREVIIPEIDAYVFAEMVENAGKTESGTVTAANVYDLIVAATEYQDEKKVPDSGRVLVVTPAVYRAMKQNDDILKAISSDVKDELRSRGVIAMLDGMKVIKVTAATMPANFAFMLAHPSATVAPVKLETYKVHEDAPGISGSLVEGRICYDAFVLDNKADAIYVYGPTGA